MERKIKLSWTEFLSKYFNATDATDGRYYNPSGELLNLRIAADFYDEYTHSNYTIKQYIEQTTTVIDN